MKTSSLNKGLVGHWPLDKQSFNPATKRFTDKSAHCNHGTGYGTKLGSADPGFQADHMGQLVRSAPFNGSDDYVDLPAMTLGTSWSVSCWYKPTNFIQYTHLLTADNQGSFAFKIFSNSGEVYFYTSASGSILSNYTLSTGIWYHLVVTYDGTDVKIIIDNDEKVSSSETLDISSFGYKIGNHNTEFSCGTQENTRIYNRVLSQQEITLLYESYRPKLAISSLHKGLVLDMPLTSERHNPGTDVFTDRTPYNNHGANNGADVDTDHSTFVAANSDYVRIPDSVSLSPTVAMTAMIWVKGTAQDYIGVLEHFDTGVNQRSFALWTSSSSPYDVIRVLVSDDGNYAGHSKDYTSSIVVFNNTWHLIGFIFDAGTLKLFVDGVEDTNPTKSSDDAITTIHNSTADIVVGCTLSNNTPAKFFSGDLALPKIYNRALTPAEWMLAYDQTKGLYL